MTGFQATIQGCPGSGVPGGGPVTAYQNAMMQVNNRQNQALVEAYRASGMRSASGH